MENEKKNNGTLVGILIGIVLTLLVVGGLFATGTIGFKTSTTSDNDQTSENNQTNISNSNTDSNTTIQTKLVDNLNCSNSETTFNGIIVKVEQKEENMVCMFSNITINGKKFDEIAGSYVESYEIYDNNVIMLLGNTSSKVFIIYNTSSNIMTMKLAPNSLEGYWVDSYKTSGNKITINGKECGEQCGNKSTGYIKATFEIEYSNGYFSTPKLIEKLVS